MSAGDPKLTEYSHGGGCGCKISPKSFKTIQQSSQPCAEVLIADIHRYKVLVCGRDAGLRVEVR